MKYQFIYKDSGVEGDMEVIYNLDAVDATAVLRAFKYFLLAVSFHPDTLKDAFEEVAGE